MKRLNKKIADAIIDCSVDVRGKQTTLDDIINEAIEYCSYALFQKGDHRKVAKIIACEMIDKLSE